jgi:hypothetical protein
MFYQKSVRELRFLLDSLKSKLAELDGSAVRDRNRDYSLISSTELIRILRSQLSFQKKRIILLGQIGFVRINLFSEYHERVLRLEKNKNFGEAVRIMNDYVENVAIPFIAPIKKPSLVERFVNWISRKRPVDPIQYVRQWRNDYYFWFKETDTKIIPALCESIRKVKFDQIKTNFYLLYNFSFSKDSFPPQRPIMVHDPNYVIDY